MNLQSLVALIKRLTVSKKNELLLTLGYLAIVIVLHWRFSPDLNIIYFLAGGVLGVYFLDLAEMIFKIQPSPYRNVLFQSAFILTVFFVLTSSGSLFGAGLVLAIYFSTLVIQWLQIKEKGRMDEWFSLIKAQMTPASQIIYLSMISIVFILLNLLFV